MHPNMLDNVSKANLSIEWDGVEVEFEPVTKDMNWLVDQIIKCDKEESMNKLSDKVLESILEDLGVEQDEVFGIEGATKDFSLRFHNNTLQYNSDTHNEWRKSILLEDLLTGECEIIKKKWKPEMGQTYYIPSLVSQFKYDKLEWTNSFRDRELFQKNLVTKTKRQAMRKTSKMLAVLEEE